MEKSDCHVINLFSENKNPEKLKFDDFLQHLPKNIIYKIDRDKSFIYFRNDHNYIFIADFGIIVIFGDVPEFINNLKTLIPLNIFTEEFRLKIQMSSESKTILSITKAPMTKKNF